MKKSTLIIVMLLISCVTIAQTSTELLNKAIAFHDPLNKWSDYSGTVNLITVRANGNSSGGELIEIQTKDDYYKCTNIKTKVVKGVKNGKCFRQIDGNNNPDDELINNSNLSDENILWMKSLHFYHFGILMELKASGLVLQQEAKTVKLEGKDYKAIEFIYDEAKLKDQFYKNLNVTIYIDPDNYSMKGVKFEGEGGMNFHALFTGLITINDIKLPLCRTYFNNEDNSFYIVDVFSLPAVTD